MVGEGLAASNPSPTQVIPGLGKKLRFQVYFHPLDPLWLIPGPPGPETKGQKMNQQPVEPELTEPELTEPELTEPEPEHAEPRNPLFDLGDGLYALAVYENIMDDPCPNLTVARVEDGALVGSPLLTYSLDPTFGRGWWPTDSQQALTSLLDALRSNGWITVQVVETGRGYVINRVTRIINGKDN